MRRRDRIILMVVLLASCLAAAPATQPATEPSEKSDPALWATLDAIDARAGRIKSLSADFQQQRFTTLLRKPLISTGKVRIAGAFMRWDTSQPQPSVLLIDPHRAQVYYPSQKVLEIYPLDRRLAEMAASPLPRLAVLKREFSLQQISVSKLDGSARRSHFLALRLAPLTPSLAEHIREVRVLLDIQAGYIVKAEVTDADGDRTLLSFKNVQLNGEVGDLALVTPPGVVTSHPLEGLDGQSPQSQGSTQ